MPNATSFLFVSSMLAGGVAPGAAPESGPASEFAAKARPLVEGVVKARTGRSLSSFSCDAPRGPREGGFVDCASVDERGNSARYVFVLDGNLAPSLALYSFPPAGLTAEELGPLEAPCRAFLDAYGRADWAAASAGLHPSLRNAWTPDEVRAALGTIRNALGRTKAVALRELSFRPPVHVELVYSLVSENGPGFARLRIGAEGSTTRVTEFSVSAEPGSPVRTAIIRESARTVLSRLAGEPVRRVDAPLERLLAWGDSVLGTAVLESGGDLHVRVEQTGRDDDFDPDDSRCQIVDAPFLVTRMIGSRGQIADSVECPARVVADGGTQVCRVRLRGGERLAVKVLRRGGDVLAETTEPFRD